VDVGVLVVFAGRNGERAAILLHIRIELFIVESRGVRQEMVDHDGALAIATKLRDDSSTGRLSPSRPSSTRS